MEGFIAAFIAFALYGLFMHLFRQSTGLKDPNDPITDETNDLPVDKSNPSTNEGEGSHTMMYVIISIVLGLLIWFFLPV